MNSDGIISIAKQYLKISEATPDQYASMKYPSLIPFMRFTVHQFQVEGYGNLMTMDTIAMGGLMKLCTSVFTPSSGKGIPFLLIDNMSMRDKHLAYVEYYDCTANTSPIPASENQKAEFSLIPDYNEKQAWYVSCRTPYSLIKGGKGVGIEALDDMVRTCVHRYCAFAVVAKTDEVNLSGLKAFQNEMIDKGNPSSETLKKVLGEKGAADFFRSVIMPVRKNICKNNFLRIYKSKRRLLLPDTRGS